MFLRWIWALFSPPALGMGKDRVSWLLPVGRLGHCSYCSPALSPNPERGM